MGSGEEGCGDTNRSGCLPSDRARSDCAEPRKGAQGALRIQAMQGAPCSVVSGPDPYEKKSYLPFFLADFFAGAFFFVPAFAAFFTEYPLLGLKYSLPLVRASLEGFGRSRQISPRYAKNGFGDSRGTGPPRLLAPRSPEKCRIAVWIAVAPVWFRLTHTFPGNFFVRAPCSTNCPSQRRFSISALLPFARKKLLFSPASSLSR